MGGVEGLGRGRYSTEDTHTGDNTLPCTVETPLRALASFSSSYTHACTHLCWAWKPLNPVFETLARDKLGALYGHQTRKVPAHWQHVARDPAAERSQMPLPVPHHTILHDNLAQPALFRVRQARDVGRRRPCIGRPAVAAVKREFDRVPRVHHLLRFRLGTRA